MFSELEILAYYPLYNGLLACFVTMAIFGIKNKSYTWVNIAFAFIYAISASLLLAYLNLHSNDLLGLIIAIIGIDIYVALCIDNSYSGTGSGYISYHKLPAGAVQVLQLAAVQTLGLVVVQVLRLPPVQLLRVVAW